MSKKKGNPENWEWWVRLSKEPVPQLTQHAIQRFQERIEPLAPERIQEWLETTWRKLNKTPHPTILQRTYKGESRNYLSCRTPGGRVAYLALSQGQDAVLTVLDVWHWSHFRNGKKKPPEQLAMEKLIQKLKTEETTTPH